MERPAPFFASPRLDPATMKRKLPHTEGADRCHAQFYHPDDSRSPGIPKGTISAGILQPGEDIASVAEDLITDDGLVRVAH